MVLADIKVSFMAPQDIYESRRYLQFAATCTLLEGTPMRRMLGLSCLLGLS
jgi:hypothetical protein